MVAFIKLCMFCISVGTFACIVASLCGSQWVTLTTQGAGGNQIAAFNNGLWRECVDDGSPDLLCMDIENDQRELTSKSKSWLKHVRGIGIAACVTASFVVILTAVGYWKNKVIYAATLMALITGKFKNLYYSSFFYSEDGSKCINRIL